MTECRADDFVEVYDLTFVDNGKFAKALTSTRAGAVLINQQFQSLVPSGLVVLLTSEPYKGFVLVARELHRDTLRPASLFETDGIASNASVHASARLACDVTADPGAVIGPRASIGAGIARLGPTGRNRNGRPDRSELFRSVQAVRRECDYWRPGHHPSGLPHRLRRIWLHQRAPPTSQGAAGRSGRHWDGVQIGAGTTVDRGVSAIR